MSLLRDRRLARLVVGQAVNAIGSWCALVALWGYASFRFDAAPTQIALLGLAWALPSVLLGPIGGVPVDRFGPKRVLVIADTVAAGVALLFILAGSFEALIALAAVEGATKAFAEPAFQSLPPRLVDAEQLASANGLLALASQSAIAFGPMLAAGAIGLFGFDGAFVVNALTYLVGVAVLLPFRIGPAPRAAERASDSSVRADLREGLAVVGARPALQRLLILATSVYLIWGAFIVVEPIYVREILHGTPTTFALLQTTFGVGLFATGLIVTRLGDRVAHTGIVCAGAIGSGLAAMVYVGSATTAVAFGGILLWGIVTGMLIAPLRTLVQRESPVEAQGRVFALDGTLHNTADLFALTIVGALATTAGVQAAGVAMAAVPIVGGSVIAWRFRRAGATARLDAGVEAAAA